MELSRGGKYRVIRPTVDTMRREFQQLPKDAAKVTSDEPPLPEPHEVRAAITERLMTNTDLLGLLAANPPWNAPKGIPIPQNSIVPMDEIEKMTPRYVGIMAGPMPRRNASASTATSTSGL